MVAPNSCDENCNEVNISPVNELTNEVNTFEIYN